MSQNLYHYLVGMAEGDPVVVIKILNVDEVVRKQGGGLAAAANALLPATVRGKVYDTVKEQLSTEFLKQGVRTEISVASVPPTGKPLSGKRDFLTGVVVGGATVGAGWLAWKYLLARIVVPLLGFGR